MHFDKPDHWMKMKKLREEPSGKDFYTSSANATNSHEK